MVELNSWNLFQSFCLSPYQSLILVKISMMAVMPVLSFLVTTARAGLLPRLQVKNCPMAEKENGDMGYWPSVWSRWR